MKKSLLSLAGIVMVSALFAWVANAQLDWLEISELFDQWNPISDNSYTRLLSEYDTSRWYLNDSDVECSAEASINVSFSALSDADVYDVNVYRLVVSPYRMNQLKNGDPAVDFSKVIMKEIKLGWSKDAKISIFSEIEWLDDEQAYYGFLVPVNEYDIVWTPSKEICFQKAGNMCFQDTACDTFDLIINPENDNWTEESDSKHGAASDCIWMDMANVTHTVNGDTLTLKWTAVDWDTVEIGIRDTTGEAYKSLWAVKMSDEKFDYKMQWDGEQNFQLTNWCKGVNYKADSKKSWPEKIVTPATGPAENVLYIAIAAIILYGAYAIFFRKSDNN